MAAQSQSWPATNNNNNNTGAPPELNVRRLRVGDKFARTVDLRVAAERSFLANGKGMRSDHRVTGSRSKLYRCDGAIIDLKNKSRTTEGCQALIRACLQRATKEWKVTEVCYEHALCSGGTKNASSRALQTEASKFVHSNRAITTPSLIDTLKSQIGCVKMSRRSANRLRKRILDAGDAEASESYMMLESFLEFIRNNCGGSVTDCQWDNNNHFSRCFIMLGGAAYFAITQGVQKVFTLDAVHLKGVWNGVLLMLSFKDSNNSIVHVATAVCKKENAEAYVYLLENVMKFDALQKIINNESTTCFTGGQKGSGTALSAMCPLTEDRRCLDHILRNIPAVGEAGKTLCYEMSKAPTKKMFDKNMMELKEIKPVSAEALDKKTPSLWANYADRGNVTWNQSTTNLSESTNSMLDAQTRSKPVLHMLEDILMQTASRLDAAAKSPGIDSALVPFAQAKYNLELEWSQGLEVEACGQGVFLVSEQGRRHYGNRVTLRLKDCSSRHRVSCTCAFYERWVITCRHMIAVATHMGDTSWTLDVIDEGFRVGRYRLAAADPRYSIVPPLWHELTRNPKHLPPLPVGGQAGRPGGKRPTKRKASNSEYITHSRVEAVQLNTSPSLNSSQGGTAETAVVIDGV